GANHRTFRRKENSPRQGRRTLPPVTETRTLEFESPRALQSLFANDVKLLKTMEDSLGIKVTTREGWVKLEGEPQQLARAQRVFDQWEQARQKGVNIQKHEFSYALSSVSEE